MSFENQGGNEQLTESVDLVSNLSEFFDDKGLNGDEFIEMYESIDDEELKEKYLKICNRLKDNQEFLDYVNLTQGGDGFPIDRETLNIFIKNFGINKANTLREKEEEKEEKEEEKEEKEEEKEEKEEEKKEKEGLEKEKEGLEKEIEKIKRIKKIELGIKLKNNSIYSKFFIGLDFPERGENEDDKVYEAKLNQFYIDLIDNNFEEILQIAAEQGGEKEFREIYKQLSDLNLKGFDFSKTFDNYLKESSKIVSLSEKKAVEYGIDKSTYYKTEINGDKITYGDQVIDMGTKPPKKFIKSKEGYQLESGTLDFRINRELRKEKFSLEKTQKTNEAQLQSLETNKKVLIKKYSKIQSIDYFDDDTLEDLFKNTKNQKIKTAIQNVDEDKDNIEKINNLKSLLIDKIEEDAMQLDRDIDKISNDIRLINERLLLIENQIQNSIDKYKKNLKEKDEKVRETLKFLKSTGFDLIPQEITDQLITEIKGNVLNVEGIPLNLETLDLANGRFGESGTDSDGDQWKINLIRFMNKMIYGEAKPASTILNESTFISSMGATADSTELKSLLEKNGIMTNMGFSIIKMRENLSKKQN